MGVLALLADRLFKECELERKGGTPVNTDHIMGEIRILEGLQSATKYLSHLDTVSSNVTRLEVENE
ncbi:MAG: hypothetical protein E2O54_03925 [Gammaproteobacteria bacterium]|nr:MAG: hypothetical protein E2O54_03925 [Gammaproteobacteria bacterium]